ncbi:MAG: ATPase, partial [Lachnospiraceae bacterium]|nr:ATPase [Lachnospiraceae bacterium]
IIIFIMVVLEKALQQRHAEIDIINTPSGNPVAMVHCNNCTNDMNAWAGVLRETAQLFGADPEDGTLFTRLYEKSLEGDADCGGVLTCNYMAGEGVTHLDAGRPFVLRRPESRFTLANFLRSQLYATMVTLRLGMEILQKENVKIDSMTGHGGLFKTPVVGQKYMAAACEAPITVMETAGEGGPYGMALLAAFMEAKQEKKDAEATGETLEDFLENMVFAGVKCTTQEPDPEDVEGFAKYTDSFRRALAVEEKALERL